MKYILIIIPGLALTLFVCAGDYGPSISFSNQSRLNCLLLSELLRRSDAGYTKVYYSFYN